MTRPMRLVPTAIIVVVLMAGCTDSDQITVPTGSLLPDDVLVARLALMECIHYCENLDGVPDIIFAGCLKWDNDECAIEDLPDEVFRGLHSGKFTIEPASKMKFEPLAKEPLYFITHKFTGERGIRLLVDELKCNERSATVIINSVRSSLDGEGIRFQVFLSRRGSVWQITNTERTF